MKKITKSVTRSFLHTLSTSVAILPCTALADKNTADNSPVVLEEIVVTANKRSQSLQDVPSSITALSGRKLSISGDDDFGDYLRTVPGVTMVDRGTGRNKIIIRGVSDGPNTSTAAVTGVYIDETPVTNTNFNPDLKTFDIERVEVLRGPQGTLYGAGSMGGTVKIILNKPNLEEMSAKVDGTYSNTHKGGNNWALNGMLNIPVIEDKFALRGVAYYRDEDGYIDDVALDKQNVNSDETIGARFLARWQVSDRLLLDASVTHQESDIGAFPQEDIAQGELQQARSIREDQEDTWTLYNMSMQYDLDWAKLTFSTSYFDRTFSENLDISPLITGSFGLPETFPAALNNVRDYAEYNSELRLVSDLDGPLQWIVGVFYSNREETLKQYVDGTGFPLPFGDYLIKINIGREREQLAGFGEVSYDLTGKLKATLGLRWFKASGDDRIVREGILAGVMPGADPDIQLTNFSENSVNPKFLLSYQASDDLLLYAEAAQGFRIGGPNVAVPANICAADLATLGLTESPTSYRSDSLWNYELGAKASFANNRVTMNSSLFYIDWTDIQVNRTLGCGFGFIDNAGKSTSKGMEAELSILPVNNLQLTAGVAYTDAKLEEDAPSVGAVKGDPVPNIPEWTVTLSMHYSFAISKSLDGYIRGDYSYNSGSLNDFAGLGEAFTVNQPDYDIGNLRIGIQSEAWEASIFVDNIWDTRAETYTQLAFYTPHKIISRPRTIGINVKSWF